jgi:O-antigen/teichoic acid export membrane protein
MASMQPRSLTAKTLLLAFGKILSAFAAVGITAMLARLLTIQDYATHKQALMIYALVAPPLMLGLPKALYFFLPGEKERPRGVLLENLAALAACSLVFGIGLLMGGGEYFARHFNNPNLVEVIPMTALYGICMVPLAAFSACMMATDRVGVLVRFQIGTQTGLILAVGIAAYVYGNPRATTSAYALWALVALCIAMILMLKATLGGVHSRPTISGIKAQLSFGIPLGLAAMFGGLSAQIDKLMVSVMCSTEDFAVYVTGAVELPLIGVVTGAMNAVILPELAKFYKRGELHKIVLLWQRAMNKAILILAPAMFLVLLFGSELIVLLFSADYAAAADPFKIYALGLPLRAAVYGSVLMATNRTKWVTISAVFGLALNACLNWIFVSWLGYRGAAWATVLAIHGVVFVMLIPMSLALRTRPLSLFDWPYLAKVCGATTLPAIAVYFLGQAVDVTGALRLALGSLVYGASVLALYAALRIATLADILSFLRRTPSS